MTKQQENRAFAKMLKEFPKAFGRVSFRERLMLRASFDYVNEEVIADLKANFDYVLEGKDLEIRELKDRLAEEVELHLHAEEYIKSLEKENEELKHNKKTVVHLADCLEEKMKERIADLEKENEELRNNGFTVSAMTEQQLKVAIEKGEQLEKENAELQHKVDVLQGYLDHDIEYDMDKELAKVIEIMGNLFEIIKRPYQFTALRKIQMVNEAEQFFKDKSQNKWVNPITTTNDPFVK